MDEPERVRVLAPMIKEPLVNARVPLRNIFSVKLVIPEFIVKLFKPFFTSGRLLFPLTIMFELFPPIIDPFVLDMLLTDRVLASIDNEPLVNVKALVAVIF